MKKLSFALALLLVLSLASGAALATTARDLVEKYSPDMQHISTMELQMEMDFGEEFIILDVRSETEFAGGRIPGAQHVDAGMLAFRIGSLIEDKDAMFIVACQTGLRSVLAVKTLQDMGYENATNLQGGFADWRDSGYPVETVHGVFVKY